MALNIAKPGLGKTVLSTTIIDDLRELGTKSIRKQAISTTVAFAIATQQVRQVGG